MGATTSDGCVVYVLHHVRRDDEYGEDAKLIGIYRSETAVNAAIERLRDQPGFRDYVAGFESSPYKFDKDHWSEGFISWSESE